MPPITWPPILYLFVLALHVALPGRWVDGYVKGADGRPLRYHLNGLRVFTATIASWALACHFGLLQWDAFWVNRWALAGSACVSGLVFTLAIVLGAPKVNGWSFSKELFLGRLENPRILGGRVDAKMFLYLVGATVLALNLCSSVAHQRIAFPKDPSPGLAFSTALFGFFLVEYLFFEEVHLYTYDFFAERVGFKLGWGCLAFYPYFYPVGAWTVADAADPKQPVALYAASVALFFSGWVLSRGANLQKFWFKRDPKRIAFGFLRPETLDGRILVSGFWGLSRHINYLGEILMAVGITLALGRPAEWAPWLYPLYYVVLLLPRQADDDRRCAAKYGELWARYRHRVRWRIVPHVY